MNPLPYDTAVLLFSRTAPQEARAKNFFAVNSLKHNRQVAKYLFRRSVRTAKESGLPSFLFTEKEQRGNSFGERLSNAVEDVFARGFQHIIIIGNDAPSLKAADLVRVALALESTSIVLSPTAKGGVSLIGMSKDCFRKVPFGNIAWQTETVFEELLQFAKTKGITYSLLAENDDINAYADVKKHLSLYPCFSSFHRLLLSLLSSFAGYCQRTPSFICCSSRLHISGLRAPPFC